MKLEYKAETEDDIADLCGCGQRAKEISKMAEHRIQAPDAYYELKGAFELIRTLLEPVEQFLCYEAVGLINDRNKTRRKAG
jgi:hypothetical protein